MPVTEPPRPAQGARIGERPSDATPAEQAVGQAETWPQRVKAMASPRYVLGQADGYPPGAKQFLQFCLILVYPAFLLIALLAWPAHLLFQALEWLLYVSFWPVRKMLGTAGKGASDT